MQDNGRADRARHAGRRLARERHRDASLALAGERYPHAHAAAGALYGGAPDDRFAFGLQLLVDGIRARIAA